MSCNVTIGEFPLNLYGEFASSANNCWENDNVFLVEALHNGEAPFPVGGNYPRVDVQDLTTDMLYYVGVEVYNVSNNTRLVTAMEFTFPTWVELDGEKVISITSRRGAVPANDSSEIISVLPVKFIHQGNYGVSAILTKWLPKLSGENHPPETEPNKGSLYAKNNLFVAQPDKRNKSYAIWWSNVSLSSRIKLTRKNPEDYDFEDHNAESNETIKVELLKDDKLIFSLSYIQGTEYFERIRDTENLILKLSYVKFPFEGTSAVHRLDNEDGTNGATLIINHS